jgi:ATP-dependent Clp protease protease subunit
MSDKLKDDISSFHDRDIYLPRRTVMIVGEIDQDMFKSVFKNLHALDYKDGDINVIINSEGGSVTHARAIYDAIKGCSNQVNALVYGEAASSASIILQAADKRYITPNADIMIHIGEEGYDSNHPKNIRSAVRAADAHKRWMIQVYRDKITPSMTERKIEQLLDFDKYIDANKALEMGLVDEIKEEI